MGRTVRCTPSRRGTGGSAVCAGAPRKARRVARALCHGACALAVQASLAGEQLHPFSGDYEGSRKIGLLTATAQARIELRRSAQYILYTLHSTVRWAFLKRQFYDCSVLRIEGDGMLPLQYLHADASDPGLDVLTRFDWTERTASTQLGSGRSAPALAVDWPTWDPMSFEVALIGLAQERRPGDAELHRVVGAGAQSGAPKRRTPRGAGFRGASNGD